MSDTRYRMRRCAMGLAAAACAAALAGPLQAQTAYTLKDLGTLGGSTSVAYDVNNNGWVTGSSSLAGDTASHAFLYNGSTMKDLGTLGGANSTGYGINDGGWVTGDAGLAGNSATHAFLYKGSALQDLGTFGGTNSTGRGINNLGVVVGGADLAVGSFGYTGRHAFTYDSQGMHDIGSLAPNIDQSYVISEAHGINDHGQVTGVTTVALEPGPDSITTNWGFYYDGTTMHPIGSFGVSHSNSSNGAAINASGVVVGSSDVGSYPTSTVWPVQFANNTLTAVCGSSPYCVLATEYGAGGVANDINAKHQIVGASDINYVSQSVPYVHAFLFQDSAMYDLNALSNAAASGWVLTDALGINDKSQIVGVGLIGGKQHAFLASPVPEPQTCALMLAGLAVLGAITRKRRLQRPGGRPIGA